MKLHGFFFLLVLAGCAPGPKPTDGRAERQPEILEAVNRLDAPVDRLGKVNVALERRVAVMEQERNRLRTEAAVWEEEMEKWQERGLTAEQRLELTLTELRKVRANWFAQLDEATSGLRAEVDELQQANALLHQEKDKLIAAAAKHDLQAAGDLAQINSQGEAIRSLTSELKLASETITRLETLLWISGSIAALAVLYLFARLLKLTPWGRAFLFWLP